MGQTRANEKRVATATLAAVEGGPAGTYNVVDDEPAPVSEWLPALAARRRCETPAARAALGRTPRGRRVGDDGPDRDPRRVERKGQRELGWQLHYPNWRQGFVEGLR